MPLAKRFCFPGGSTEIARTKSMPSAPEPQGLVSTSRPRSASAVFQQFAMIIGVLFDAPRRQVLRAIRYAIFRPPPLGSSESFFWLHFDKAMNKPSRNPSISCSPGRKAWFWGVESAPETWASARLPARSRPPPRSPHRVSPKPQISR